MLKKHFRCLLSTLIVVSTGIVVVACLAQKRPPGEGQTIPADSVADAIADAQTPRAVRLERPEQSKTTHDQADIFSRRGRSHPR